MYLEVSFNVFINLKMDKLVEKPKWVFTLYLAIYVPVVGPITCGCVQNTVADAAKPRPRLADLSLN